MLRFLVFSSFRVACWGVAAGISGVLLTGSLVAQSAGDKVAPETRTLTRVMDFWSLSNEARSRSIPVELELHVLHNDPAWGVVHVRDESGFEYIEVPSTFQARSEDVVKLVGRTTGDPYTLRLELDSWDVVGRRALVAEPVELSQLDHFARADQLVSFVGLVERQFMDDPEHLSLEMVVDGHPVLVVMLLDLEEPVPQWSGSIVRVKGVYAPKFDAEGELGQIQLWSPGVDCGEWIAMIANAPVFNLPTTALETVFEAAEPSDQRIRVEGNYVGEHRDGGMLLRDHSGQVRIKTAQKLRPERGERIEVVGRPEVLGVLINLKQALWRTSELEAAKADAPTAPTRRHRVASSVRELSPLEAAAAELVQITGVVTWSDPDRRLVFVQDSSAGIAVQWDDALGDLPPAGKLVQIQGVTAAGDFAPFVAATEWLEMSDLALPGARPITRDQAMTGLEEAQLVELTGFVFQARAEERGVNLDVATSSGEMTVRVGGETDGTQWLGAIIKATGVCVAQADEARRLVAAEIWVANPVGVEVLQDGAEQPFELPLTPLTELGRFNPNAVLRDRLRVEGTVVWVEASGGIWLNDDDVTLRIHTRQGRRPVRQEHIEVVGFLGVSEGQRILREAVWRSIGQGFMPEPKPSSAREPILAHGAIATIEGTVNEITGWSDKVRVILSVPPQPPVVVEIPDITPAEIRLRAPEGALVEVTGLVLRTANAAPGEPELRLLVPDLKGLQTLEFPSWWTRDRLIGLGLVALFLVVLVLVWATSLRRVVRKQTTQINEQNSRARALQQELERTQRMESLGSMADGITQDFEQLLQRTHTQVGEVLNQERLSREARNRLDQAQASVLRAQDLTRRLASFSLSGKSVLSPLDWADFLRKEAELFEVGPLIKRVWNIPLAVPAIEADAAQMQQVIHAILRNAMQAMPNGGTVKIGLTMEKVESGDLIRLLSPGAYVRTTIRDAGSGIAAADMSRLFDPYFSRRPEAKGLGLALAYAVIRQHRGRIEIDSTEGSGTTVSIWLPVHRA